MDTRDYDEYRAYLQSKEWKEKRRAAIERAGGRCQTCNKSNRLEVHHRTYERIFNEDPGDLTVLCCECHAVITTKIQGKSWKHTFKTKKKKIKQIQKKLSREDMLNEIWLIDKERLVLRETIRTGSLEERYAARKRDKQLLSKKMNFHHLIARRH
jgi:hypothetical protein